MSHEGTEKITPEVLDTLLAARAQFVGFVEKRVGSRATAEDIVQAAFVKSLERGGEIREHESAVAWFYRVLRNATIDHFRRNAAAGRAADGWAKDVETAVDPSKQDVADICGCITRVLTTLKPEYRSAIELVEIGDQSLADLARRQEISENNAAVRLHRARAALRRRVTDACGACATHGCLNCTCASSTASSG
jgi:RNA polymerase sigma-70 factor (ECF subfamily)